MLSELSELKYLIEVARGSYDRISPSDVQPYIEDAAAATANKYDRIDSEILRERLVVTLKSQRLVNRVNELVTDGEPLVRANTVLAEELEARSHPHSELDWSEVATTFLATVERELPKEHEVRERLEMAYDQAIYKEVTDQSPEGGTIALQNGVDEFVTTEVKKAATHTVLPLRCCRSFGSYESPGDVEDPDLMSEMKSLLADETSICMVLGEAGSGKTLFAKRLTAELYEKFATGDHRFFPLYVDMSALPSDSVLDADRLRAAALEVYLPEDYTVSTDEMTAYTPDDAVVTWILDGYDEAVTDQAPGSKERILETLFSLIGNDLNVIVLGRTSLFEDDMSLKRAVRTAGINIQQIDTRTLEGLETRFIKPLSRQQIRKFIDEEYGDERGDLFEKIEGYYDLQDLARRPILLPIVCETVDDFEDEGVQPPVSTGQLYELYTHRWLYFEDQRFRIEKQHARRIVRQLALHFHREGTGRIEGDALLSFCREIEAIPMTDAQPLEFERMLRNASFLTNDSDGSWRFIHRSFLEYFLAARIRSSVVRLDTSLELDKFPSKETDQFVVELLALADGWESNLIELVEKADDPVFRYLSVWLTSRLIDKPDNDIDRESLEKLKPLLETESNPFVVREILVALESHDIDFDESILREHARQSVPREELLRELEGYYKSLYDARMYQKSRIRDDPDQPPALFYLLNLEPVAKPEDEDILRSVIEDGTELEQMVSSRIIEKIQNGESEDGGNE